MLAYHGSPLQGLSSLQPFLLPQSNLDYPCVYLSTKEVLTVIYLWDRPFRWMTFEFGKDGTLHYFETFPDQLREFYSGISGCIYCCEGDFVEDEKSIVRGEVISRVEVPVKSAIPVADAYQQLLSYEQKGELIIHRYETLSEARKASDHRMILSEIQELNLLGGEHPALAALIREKFPVIWEQAERV